jgi:hypothetical protein
MMQTVSLFHPNQAAERIGGDTVVSRKLALHLITGNRFWWPFEGTVRKAIDVAVMSEPHRTVTAGAQQVLNVVYAQLAGMTRWEMAALEFADSLDRSRAISELAAEPMARLATAARSLGQPVKA